MNMNRAPRAVSQAEMPKNLEELLMLTGGEDRAELEHAVEELKRAIDKAPKAGRSLETRAGEFCIPLATNEHKQQLLESLATMNIYPWEESGILYIDHHRDLRKLRLAGVIPGIVEAPFEQEIRVPPELAYPLPHVEGLEASLVTKAAEPSGRGRGAARVARAAEAGVGEDVTPEMETEIAEIVERFDQGLIDEQDAGFVRVAGMLPSMRLFPRRYTWMGGRPIDVRTGDIVTEEAEQQLITKAKEGDDKAFRELSSMHRGAVLDVLLRVKRKFGGDPDDLFQEGMLGLLRAVEKYDSREDAKFATYARYGIEQRMRRFAFEHGRPVRLPVHVSGERKRVYGLRERLRRAEERGDPELYRGPDATELSELERKYLMNAAFDPVSDEEDNPIDRDTSAPMHQALQDDSVQGVPRAVFDAELKREFERALSTLTPREERVLRMRFGLSIPPLTGDGYQQYMEHSEEGLTLDQVGQLFNINRERVRQIEAKALRKLKHPQRNRALAELLRFLAGDEAARRPDDR